MIEIQLTKSVFMTCSACGNVIVRLEQGLRAVLGPTCRVCQTTGRVSFAFHSTDPGEEKPTTSAENYACTDAPAKAQAVARIHTQALTEALAAARALDATYKALDMAQYDEEEFDAALTVLAAQENLAGRIRDQQHSRTKPDWDAEDKQPEAQHDPPCHTCGGTGKLMFRPCPDCWGGREE